VQQVEDIRSKGIDEANRNVFGWYDGGTITLKLRGDLVRARDKFVLRGLRPNRLKISLSPQ
jgi:hypothetical protein